MKSLTRGPAQPVEPIQGSRMRLARGRKGRVAKALAGSSSIAARLREADMYFEGKAQVQKSLRRLVKHLKKARIPYVIAGGLALTAHRYERLTKDVDVLLSTEGFAAFRQQFVNKHYDPVPGRSRRFIDRVNGVPIDVLVSGLFPGFSKTGPFPFPLPGEVAEEIEKISYVDLPTLIELKLAARRWKDFADVVELIRYNG